ncbi:Sugar (pentulose or hexulose) kinase [Rhizobium sp. RU35A]|uniref:FGGY-family carbohydrate kinase n=1 Tax=Rhizobium sp. RU35A TaxID=1907414 RepID=UPI00095546C9|nr:FGGY-family carbohydrate kinase [Rhizobium sp. RU35A]SIR21456.1 Sugar (pentulose or hexulose) kinase [Rhizobium sp. RU35A]
MSTISRIAVLDIGKTNAKVLVLDCATGAELSVRRRPNRVLSGPLYPHYDIEALWAFFREALAALYAETGFDAISITTHGASGVLLDAEGGLVLPVLDYEHTYSAEIRAAYAALRPPFAETFSPALSGGLNLGAQIHYQKTAFADAFARVRTILTYPQYWAFRLTGIVANEVTSLGCHTDLWQPATGNFSSLVDRLGIREKMAPVRSAFDALGPVLPALAAELGLEAPVPVYCGIHDSNASLLPHLVGRDAPFAVVSTGTWVISFGVGGDLQHLDPARDTLANVDAYGRAVPSSRFMGGREFEMLAAELGPYPADEMRPALAEAVRDGVMLLPNVAEGSGPFPGRARTWLNAEGCDTRLRWAAATLYLALMTEACLDLIGADGPALVEGPFAANPAYLATLSALLAARGDRPVLALSGSTGTAHGAALLAGTRPAQEPADPVRPLAVEGLEAYRSTWRARLT